MLLLSQVNQHRILLFVIVIALIIPLQHNLQTPVP
jgi:hypothetical protein